MKEYQGLMISGHKVFLLHKLKTKEKEACQGLLIFSSLGALLILSFKGRRELLATKCILWKERSKDPLGRALGGLRIGTGKWFMACGD